MSAGRKFATKPTTPIRFFFLSSVLFFGSSLQQLVCVCACAFSVADCLVRLCARRRRPLVCDRREQTPSLRTTDGRRPTLLSWRSVLFLSPLAHILLCLLTVWWSSGTVRFNGFGCS
uniref:Uncharacterized protein n=1 Tax=Ixodes scapularis TaxID=6945 RepID=A0A4D5RCM9_IXOSC